MKSVHLQQPCGKTNSQREQEVMCHWSVKGHFQLQLLTSSITTFPLYSFVILLLLLCMFTCWFSSVLQQFCFLVRKVYFLTLSKYQTLKVKRPHYVFFVVVVVVVCLFVCFLMIKHSCFLTVCPVALTKQHMDAAQFHDSFHATDTQSSNPAHGGTTRPVDYWLIYKFNKSSYKNSWIGLLAATLRMTYQWQAYQTRVLRSEFGTVQAITSSGKDDLYFIAL